MRFSTTGLVWRGILAILVGIVALAWPGITIGAFVVLFAVYTFLAGVTELVLMAMSRRAGPVLGHLLFAVIDVAAGVVAIIWPGVTALVLVLVIGVWAIAAGIAEIAMAFREGGTAGRSAVYVLSGLLSIAFGVVVMLRPGIGAVAIAQVFGLFGIFIGISMLVTAADTRATTAGPPDPARHQAAEQGGAESGQAARGTHDQPAKPEAQHTRTTPK